MDHSQHSPAPSPDVQDLPDLLFTVRLSRNDQQPVQQVNGDTVWRPAQHTPIQQGAYGVVTWNKECNTASCPTPKITLQHCTLADSSANRVKPMETCLQQTGRPQHLMA